MRANAFKRNTEKIECLRNNLYQQVNGQRELLCSKEVYEVSKRLDKLIAKQMYAQYKKMN
jgi:hypothetical protein